MVKQTNNIVSRSLTDHNTVLPRLPMHPPDELEVLLRLNRTDVIASHLLLLLLMLVPEIEGNRQVTSPRIAKIAPLLLVDTQEVPVHF